MESFLTKWVARHTESTPALLQPRIASRFEEPTTRITPSWSDEASPNIDPPRLAPSHSSGETMAQRLDRPIPASPSEGNLQTPVPHSIGREHGLHDDLEHRLRQTERILKGLQSTGSDPSSTTSPFLPRPSVDLPSPATGALSKSNAAWPVSAEPPNASPVLPATDVPLPTLASTPLPRTAIDRLFENSQRTPSPTPLPETVSRPPSARPNLIPSIVPQSGRSVPSQAPRIAPTDSPSNTAPSNTVHVSIGRIEIRNPKRAAEPAKPPAIGPKPKIMTLTEYVQSRERGRS